MTKPKIERLLKWGVGVHLISFFAYAIWNNFIVAILKFLIFDTRRLHLYLYGNMCVNGKVPHPQLNAIDSIAFLSIRIIGVLLIALAIKWIPQRRQLLNEGIYFNYENDLLYLLLLPVPSLLGDEPYRYFFPPFRFSCLSLLTALNQYGYLRDMSV